MQNTTAVLKKASLADKQQQQQDSHYHEVNKPDLCLSLFLIHPLSMFSGYLRTATGANDHQNFDNDHICATGQSSRPKRSGSNDG